MDPIRLLVYLVVAIIVVVLFFYLIDALTAHDAHAAALNTARTLMRV